MKKLLLATCLLSSAAFANESPLSVEFTAGYIPTQDVKLQSGGASITLGNDGYFFRAALNDGKFRAFGSMQQVDGTTCGTGCVSHEAIETRGGMAFTALDNGQLKLAPRLEYVTLDLTLGNSTTSGNGFAFGADATLLVTPNVDVFGGASYLEIEDYKGSEFKLGATFKTQIVNFMVEGRHLNLDDSVNDTETTSNELKLGVQKAFDF